MRRGRPLLGMEACAECGQQPATRERQEWCGVGGDYATVSDNGDADDEEFLTHYLCDDCWNKLPAHEREED